MQIKCGDIGASIKPLLEEKLLLQRLLPVSLEDIAFGANVTLWESLSLVPEPPQVQAHRGIFNKVTVQAAQLMQEVKKKLHILQRQFVVEKEDIMAFFDHSLTGIQYLLTMIGLIW